EALSDLRAPTAARRVRPMRAHVRTMLVALIAAALSAGAEEPKSPAPPRPEVRSGEPVLKFNGKDLTGFYAYTKRHGYDDPEKICTVQDGRIRVSGADFGGFATCGNFADYHLVVEWKWGGKTWPPRVDKARDSGILLHCVGPDGAAGG